MLDDEFASAVTAAIIVSAERRKRGKQVVGCDKTEREGGVGGWGMMYEVESIILGPTGKHNMSFRFGLGWFLPLSQCGQRK